MNTYSMNIESYAEELASKQPIPGGGGASAIAGMMGVCLGQMVCNLTIGKKKYSNYESEITDILARMRAAQDKYAELADKDAEVFEPLSKAYSLPHSTKKEQEAKAKAMEPLLVSAAEVPMDIMKLSYAQLEDIELLMKHGSVLAVSDAAVASQMIRTAVLGAYMNVIINTKYMQDRTVADEMDAVAEDIRAKTIIAADDIYQNIMEILR